MLPDQFGERGEKPAVFVKEFRRDHEPVKQEDGTVQMKEVVWCTYAPRGVTGRDIEIKWSQLKRGNPAVYDVLLPFYEHYMRGEQLPEGGTALSGWSGVTTGQITRLKELNIRSVEDVSAMNDAAMNHFGMGARQLKEAATAWLASREGAGVAHELVQARETIKAQGEAIADLQAMVKDLRARVGDDGQPKSRKAA